MIRTIYASWLPRSQKSKTKSTASNQAAGSVEDFMWETVKLLHDRMLKYNWVGFYMLEENR